MNWMAHPALVIILSLKTFPPQCRKAQPCGEVERLTMQPSPLSTSGGGESVP